MLPALLFIDGGSGRIVYGDDGPQAIILEQQGDFTGRLFMLFHGYNGHGKNLVDILGPALVSRGTVVAFESSPSNYDDDRIEDLAQNIIDKRKPTRLALYGESFGGMAIMDLLRSNPELHPEVVVFNATPSSASNIKLGGALLSVFNAELLLHGGPGSTELLQWQQAQDMQTVPSPEPGSNEKARQQAYKAYRGITGPIFSDELRYMGNFQPPSPGEFAGRTSSVHYLRAPSASDQIVKTAASATVLRHAFSDAVFQETTVPSWAPDLHAPTAERPGPLIATLLAASSA